MSIPIKFCVVAKATKNERDYQVFLEAMRVNMKHRAFSQWPCTCKPPCEATDEEIDALNERLAKDLQVI